LLKPLLFASAAVVLFYQIFTIGLADNGDFPRIAGRLSLCPAAGWDRDRFTYFVPDYVAKPGCYWDGQVPTAGLPVARAARALDKGPVFHIRTLGVLYALLLLAIFGWLLRASWMHAFGALVFLDIGYIAYCNSFYLEALSLAALLAVVAAALRKNAILFLLAALVLVTSKTQHAWLAVPLSVYAVCMFRPRALTLGATALLLASAGWMTVATPMDYKVSNLWNSVFVGLLPYDPGALGALHVGPEYAAYIGRNAYQFPDELTAVRWTRNFYAQAGFRSLIRYYGANPAAAARRIWRSAAQLHKIRPGYLGVYDRGSSRPPLYSWWSDCKSGVYLHAPWLAALGYMASAVLLWKSPYRSILALILAMAAIEFTLSSFADSTEDYRHHFLFHALSDVWLCFLGGHIIKVIGARFLLSRFQA
jgi:hypothetical protein